MSGAGGPRLLLRRLREIMAEQTIRPDAAGQAGRRHRLQHGGGGLLHLSAPRRQDAGVVRHRRSQPRRRPQHPAARRRGTGRPGVGDRGGGQSFRRAVGPAFLLSPGNRGRSLQDVSWACPSCAAARSSACSRCRTRPSAFMPRKKSRRCRPSPWCWPKWWRKAVSSISPNWTSRNCAIDRPRKFSGRRTVGRRRGRARGAARAARQGGPHDRRQSGRGIEAAGGSHRLLARKRGPDAGLLRTRSDRRGPRGDRGLSAVRL